jgi:hypothetical protein
MAHIKTFLTHTAERRCIIALLQMLLWVIDIASESDPSNRKLLFVDGKMFCLLDSVSLLMATLHTLLHPMVKVLT